MIAKNYSDVRNNFKEICDKVVDDSEAVIVKRKNDKDVVVISLDEYSNMMENLYVRERSENYDRLRKGIEQAKEKKGKEFNADELEGLLNE